MCQVPQRELRPERGPSFNVIRIQCDAWRNGVQGARRAKWWADLGLGEEVEGLQERGL